MDLLLDENGDIQFDDNGELVIGDSEQQDVKLFLATRPGDWKEHPTVGVDAKRFIKSRGAKTAIANAIRSQLTADGFKVIKVTVEFPNIYVDAKRYTL